MTRALLTTSCTHALELAALLLDVGPGDEVIVPSFTFVSGANAFALRGAKLVFADVRPDTLNLDERLLDDLVTERTRAIVPTHYAGVGCELDADRARPPSASARRWSRTTRTASSGAIAAARSARSARSPRRASTRRRTSRAARAGRSCSTTPRSSSGRRSSARRGRTGSGSSAARWTSTRGSGSARATSSPTCSRRFSCAQLEERARIQDARAAVWSRYAERARRLGRRQRREAPVRAGALRAVVPHVLRAAAVARRANAADRASPQPRDPRRLPLPAAPSVGDGPRARRARGPGPVTEDVVDRLVRLPFYTGMTEPEQAEVIDAVLEFAA